MDYKLDHKLAAKKQNNRWILPSNSYLSHEARNLLYRLHKVGASDAVILGQQSCNTLTRAGSRPIQDADIKDVIGEFPGMVSYDLGRIELGNNQVWLDGSVDELLSAMQYCRKLGIPICLSWHCSNPFDPTYDQKNRNAKGKIKDFGNTVAQILNNPQTQKTYLGWLDQLALFFERFRDDQGIAIPVLFRPFHECTGAWFWWGKGRCTDQQYIAMFRLTHDYLSKEKHCNNILWVYNTDKVVQEADFMLRYPGDAYIDLLSMDFYDSPKFTISTFQEALNTALTILTTAAKQLNKPCFVAEGGRKNHDEKQYFTQRAFAYFHTDLIAFCFWANSKKNYYSTFATEANKDDFKSLIQQHTILLEKKVSALKLYG